MKKLLVSMTLFIRTNDVLSQMEKFDESRRQNHPLFTFVRHYMEMVQLMMTFIRSVRTANWNLHLETIGKFVKYFFAHDKLNYARLMPLYLAEMETLKENDPDIYSEFERGMNLSCSFNQYACIHG